MLRLQSTWFAGVSTAAVVCACAVTHASTASAAEAPNAEAPTAGSAGAIEEVVVTARKRATGEVLQATPISASAVSPRQLEEAHVVNLFDVGRLMPGVTFQQGTSKGFNNFAIRGMGQSGTAPQDEAPVGLIVDGVYYATPASAVGDLFDLEGVEVLRGPQGTLFGRNVTGGAVIVRTASPTFDKAVKLMAGYGNYNSSEGSVILNAPLWGDKLAGRLSMKYRDTDGAYYNVFKRARAGSDTTSIVRAGLLFTPSEDLKVTLKGEYYESRGDSQASRGISPSTVPTSVTNPARVTSLPFLDGFRTPTDFYDIASGDNTFQNDEIYSASAELSWRLGNGVLTWINGYRRLKLRSLGDFDGTPGIYFSSKGFYDQEQKSSELRYAGVLGRVDYTVGGYYIKSDFETDQTRRLTRDTTRLASQAYQDLTSYAAFAEADIKITDSLTATVGARYTDEKKVASSFRFGTCDFTQAEAGVFICTKSPSRRYSDNNFSPKLGLAYTISPNHLVFASVTKGYRSGGYALRGTALVSPYQPEKVTAYELSSKNEFFERRVRLNVSIYQNDYKGLQRTTIATDPTVGIIQSTFNAADAKIKGVEIEGIAVLTEHLSVSANYARTNASYSSFAGIVGYAPVKDLQFVRVPEDLFNAGLNYSQPVGDVGVLEAKVGASYTSSYFYDDVNTPTNGQKAYTVYDASVTLTSLDKDWSVMVWGRNLSNAKYADFGSTLGALGQNKFIGKPRTYGIRLTRDF